MTIEMCLSTCYKYKWAGVEYGRECWCGDALDLASYNGGNAGKNVSNTECSFLCPGNNTEYCGAGVRLSLYSHIAKKNVAKRLDWSLLED